MMAILELTIRIFDQLDEQLHAGSYFYITIATSKFTSNALFVYPAALILFGFLVPEFIDFTRERRMEV
jgi:hypothetical protein